MNRSLADVLYAYGGYELQGTDPIRLTVTEKRGRQMVALDDEGDGGNPYRSARWKQPPITMDQMPSVSEQFVRRAVESRLRYIEALAGAIVHGMNVPRDDCQVKEVHGVYDRDGSQTQVTYVHPKPGKSFESFRSHWLTLPIRARRDQVPASAVLAAWEELKSHPSRNPRTNDMILLVLAFHNVMGSLPIDVELVTHMKSSGGIGWAYRRRDAGSVG